MQYKGHKIKYILLGIFGILITFFMIKGCSYPTSYRAFIPKALDSEYKEYERLCEISQKGIVYSRPLPQYIQDYYTLQEKKTLRQDVRIKSFWHSITHDMVTDTFVEGNSSQIALAVEKINKKDNLSIKKDFILLKPYIYQLSFTIQLGNTYALISSLVDSQNGTIYAYKISEVFYYTNWRQNPLTTWGYPSKYNIYCQAGEEETILSYNNPIQYLHTLKTKGNEQDILFIEKIKKHFEAKKIKLQDLLVQDKLNKEINSSKDTYAKE